MKSQDYRTGAIYESEARARLAFEALADLPLDRPEITLLEPGWPGSDPESRRAAQNYIRQLVLDALPGAGKGAAAGAGIGEVGATLLAVHSPALFVAAPIVYGLAIVAWGAWLGGVIGAGIALEVKQESLDAAIDAASRSGHWCIVVHSRNPPDHSGSLSFSPASLMSGWRKR